MKESIINALVHLFAIIESVKDNLDGVDSGELIVKPYMERHLNQELTNEYLKLYYDYLSFYREANTTPAGDHELGIDSTSILQVAKICNQLNKELLYPERIIVFLQLLELMNTDNKVSAKENEFIFLVAMNFNLNQDEVKSMQSFILDPKKVNLDPHNGLVIDNKMTEWPEEVAWMMRKKNRKIPGATAFLHMYVENLFGQIFVLRIESTDTYVFKYEGPLNLYLEGNKIVKNKFYLLKPGTIIKGPNIESIYETDITQEYLKDKNKVKIVLTGENVAFHFKNSTNGIQEFNFHEESGNLIGVMGGSGVGKSTLINLLNGKISPTKGRVAINGYSIPRASIEGVIGYVPQDDLLFEELTVYENLYFNAQISFSDFLDHLLNKTVDKVLQDLDLGDIKDLKVGDPLNKFISGGQRKRLNIALELMREPSVLFVDEPTSGLSSMDSEKVMQLLKNLSRRGKLVLAIIHQPSSDIFKLFDKLWLLDKGGFPIYNGNPIDAVVYFKTMSTQVNAAESECTRCGNVIPEQILQIIEAKEIDDYGRVTQKRRVSPDAWYSKYKENIEKNLKRIRYEERLPPTNFNIPSLWHQFKIFSKRNLRSKQSNFQYILINALEAPVLALILGFFTKYAPDGNYSFIDNKNLPVFMFMAVVVALFMGMSVSAEEIFKDRKILERESFLNLSRFSYINSKVFYLFSLSAVQTLSFVIIGNLILEIQGMTFFYWVILFSTSCFANLIGLNISSALNSIITIYILIPFILVPQLLLGGALVKFDELQQGIAKQEYVPVVGDIMVSRWAYEAITVAQFKHNDFEKLFFDSEKDASSASFKRSYLLPKMESITRQIIRDSSNYGAYADEFDLLKYELKDLEEHQGLRFFSLSSSLHPDLFHTRIGNRLLTYFDYAKGVFKQRYELAVDQKDSTYESQVNIMGRDALYALKRAHHNESVADLVENRNEFNKIIRSANHFVQKKDPIFREPYTHYGRAHFYAPYKQILDLKVDTVLFNMIVIWVLIGLLYLALLDNTLKKTLNIFSGKKKS